MKIGTVTEIFSSSEIGKLVLAELSNRKRASKRTDLKSLYFGMKAQGKTDIELDEFVSLFRLLEKAGIGIVEKGKKNSEPIRFIWRIPVTELMAKINGDFNWLEGDSFEKQSKSKGTGKPGRPPVKKQNPVSQIEAKPSQLPPLIQFSIQISPSTPIEQIEALMKMARQLQKNAS